MKISLAFAATIAAANAYVLKQAETDEGVDLDTDSFEDIWEEMENTVFYVKNAYLGAYQGLYSMTTKSQVVKPDKQCFGDWIPEKLHAVTLFGDQLLEDPFSVEYEQAKDAAYSWVDLLFLNDEYCHFRDAFWDLYSFCDNEENCSFDSITSNMQTNAFSMIT